MANWADNSPDETTNYITVLTNLRDRDKDAAKAFVTDPTNPQENFFRFNRAGNKFQEYLSAVWVDKVLSIAGGGTGATSAGAIRTNLGLGTMSLQNDNAVSIMGGNIGGATNISAYSLTAGLVMPPILGSGSTTLGNLYLADNQTWKPIPAAVPVGTILMYTGPAASVPADYNVCWGQAISRAGFPALFAIIGTTYGAGDGSTTFNVPQMLGAFPMCHAWPGHPVPGIGMVGGAFDHNHGIPQDGNHAHAGPAHQHTTDVHAHAAGAYVTANHNHGGNVANASLDSRSDLQSGGGSSATWDGVHSHTIGNSNPAVTGTSANAGGGLTSVAGDGPTSAAGNHAHTGYVGPSNPPYVTLEFIIKVV